jgi:hypothetical protein
MGVQARFAEKAIALTQAYARSLKTDKPLTVIDMMETYCVDRNTVMRWIEWAELPKPKKNIRIPIRQVTTEISKAVELVRQGWRPVRAAKRCGVTASRVRTVARRLGVLPPAIKRDTRAQAKPDKPTPKPTDNAPRMWAAGSWYNTAVPLLHR